MTQREIKFRVWDGDAMYDATDYPDYTLDTFTTVHKMKPEYRRLLDRFTLMQYTGLKDRNGREIYEGDIVRWGHIEGGEEDPVRIAEVRIDPDIQFVAHNIPSSYRDKDCHVFHYGTFAYRDTHNWLDIIGNVFQHPELIKR
jgi:uncharacterized phage protein (TIGR01671 family)